MTTVRAALVVLTAMVLAGCIVRTRPAPRGAYHCHAGIPRICHSVVHR